MSIFSNIKKDLSTPSNKILFDDASPKFWISTGNYVINKIMSGKWDRGIPQGRITCLAGPSGAGKSFLVGNIIREAQKSGMLVLVIDSEHALDKEFLGRIGVNTEDEKTFMYVSLSTISSCTKTVNTTLKYLREAQEDGKEHPNLLIVIDSLDFLFVDSAMETYEKEGELNNDQGLQAKKWKQMLSTIVSDIKSVNAAIVITKQVYVDQSPYASPPWKMTESVKFAFSQLFLVTKLLERDKKTKDIDGINLKVFGWKTRFTKPFQQCEVYVPYDKGLDPFEGLLKAAESIGVVNRSGAWYSFGDKKFQSSNFDSVKNEVLQEMIKRESENIVVEIDKMEDTSGALDESEMKSRKLDILKKIKEEK
jgi:recombination protein RecA